MAPDVVILGAGPIGLTSAIMLLERNPDLHLTLYDKNPPDNTIIAQGDQRGIAISEGSKQLLESMGAWLLQPPVIHEVHISQKDHFGQTIIRRDELGKDALGYIVRYADIHLQLRQKLQVIQAQCPHFIWHYASPMTEVTDLPKTTCVVHADGGLFHQQEAKDQQVDYQQSALVGWVETQDITEHIAWERFTAEGPLAILPHHQGKNARNLVWCASPERIEALVQLDAKDFLLALKNAFGLPIGEFTQIHDRRSYPLGLNIRNTITHEHEVWIGNAAQTLHPVAGQGLNLGLRDAATLTQCLGHALIQPLDKRLASLTQALKQYATLRQKDRQATIGVTDLMARVFATDLAPVVMARGLALSILQWIPPLKKAVAYQMMFGQR